jgi:excisionase family DNA binding protein
MMLNVCELSKEIKISVSTLYKWVSQKKIPYAKIGRRVVFDERDIEKWFEDKKVGFKDFLV